MQGGVGKQKRKQDVNLHDDSLQRKQDVNLHDNSLECKGLALRDRAVVDSADSAATRTLEGVRCRVSGYGLHDQKVCNWM